ncbi:DUF4288 domain-containing protein [Hymenobacter sp. DG01]|uniref:DUF4288 domain-containing protein n=1 Tax=Hymenobacter sp. DG01 TaxID=2584940 RepID=UPI0011231359|nr:DUF4288 domain-containing protein [Hymenobacter sp. DG01]
MLSNKISNLKEWKLGGLPEDALIEVSIHFNYPPTEELQPLLPAQRVKRINEIMRQNIQVVVGQIQPVAHSPSPDNRRPRGMRCSLPAAKLPVLCSIEQVKSVTIGNAAGSKRIVRRKKEVHQFFCVRMTVAIQIEGKQDGLQGCEERFVLIKASSREDAYGRVEAASSTYSEPYLNSDGYLVRWKVESLDDCYETGITKLSEFTALGGVEVFSGIKNRRMTLERTWDGKAE